MDEVELHEKLSELKALLDEKESSPELPYWGVDDEATSYCRHCIKAIYDGEAESIHGGFSCEEDGCCHCEECGNLLQYTLTNYGVESELANFEAYPPENLDNADMCYELGRIAWGLYGQEDMERFINLMSPLVERLDNDR